MTQAHDDHSILLFRKVLASKRSIDDVAAVLREFEDLSITDSKSGRNLCHIAAVWGRSDVLKFLMQKGVDADCCDDEEFTQLELAVLTGDIGCVKLLTSAHAYPEQELSDALELVVASRSEDALAIQNMLVELGANPNHRGFQGRPPLHTATRDGNIDAVAELLKSGAKVNTQDKFGFTALHHAVHRNDTDMVNFLLKNGADPLQPDREGILPIHVAARSNDTASQIVLLSSMNPQHVHMPDSYGWTPLHFAVRNNAKDCVAVLVSLGVNTTRKTTEGQLPIEMRSDVCDAIRAMLCAAGKSDQTDQTAPSDDHTIDATSCSEMTRASPQNTSNQQATSVV